MLGNAVNIIVHVLIAAVIQVSQSCPLSEVNDAKAAYKSGEIPDQSSPITLDKIKTRLKESEIFDWQDPTLTDREKKEMNKLFDAVEIMTSSRNRQPQNVQTLFSSLRLVERVVKKQLKEGQISENLASKFNWDKLIPSADPDFLEMGPLSKKKEFMKSIHAVPSNQDESYEKGQTNILLG